jgi:hypothetical protein
MQNEKQNKHIQSALNDLQQLPVGVTFSSQKVWAGLEQQLPNSEPKKRSWYYAAAAILFLIIITSVVFLNKTKQSYHAPTIVTTPVVPAKNTSFLPVRQQKNKEPLITHTSSHTVKHTANTNILILPGQKETPPPSTQYGQPGATVPEQVAATVLPAEKIILAEKKSIPVVVPKPKYRIIHLNELDQSLAPVNSALTRSELKRNSQQHTDEKEITIPPENNKQLFYFKIKPVTTTSILEN